MQQQHSTEGFAGVKAEASGFALCLGTFQIDCTRPEIAAEIARRWNALEVAIGAMDLARAVLDQPVQYSGNTGPTLCGILRGDAATARRGLDAAIALLKGGAA